MTALYSDAYFTGGGAGYPDYLAETQLLREHGHRYAKLLRKFLVRGRLLDVGAAAGCVAQGFGDYGWDVTALEPNERMASMAASVCSRVISGSLEDALIEGSFELVSMIQVVAHVYDLHRALQNALSVTSPRGYWLIETWNGESVTARILGRQWHEFSPPTVLRVFTPPALDKIAGHYGFERVATGRPQKWVLASHAKSLLVHKSGDGVLMEAASRVARILPDRLRLPCPSEDLFWSLYRKIN
ncbi:MAG: class I SAM-dependent methyltransferase [Candidatus Tyrphobacter sp.]